MKVNRRGFVLLLVTAIIGALSVAMVTYFIRLSASAQTTGEMVRRRQTFYSAQGMGNSMVGMVQNYLSANPSSSESR